MATKASASAAFNSYFYQQANTAQNGGKPMDPANSEQSGDLHLKMSKKIAQLTKVLTKYFTLNSYNKTTD